MAAAAAVVTIPKLQDKYVGIENIQVDISFPTLPDCIEKSITKTLKRKTKLWIRINVLQIRMRLFFSMWIRMQLLS